MGPDGGVGGRRSYMPWYIGTEVHARLDQKRQIRHFALLKSATQALKSRTIQKSLPAGSCRATRFKRLSLLGVELSVAVGVEPAQDRRTLLQQPPSKLARLRRLPLLFRVDLLAHCRHSAPD